MTDAEKGAAVNRRAQFLEVLGIRTEWLPRGATVAAEPAEDVVALADAGETAEAAPAAQRAVRDAQSEPARDASEGAGGAVPTAQRAPAQDAPVGAAAEARGVGERDGAPAVGRAPVPAIVSPLSPQRAAEIVALDWAGLQASVAGCTACGLCESRTQTVFGVGDRAAEWLLVGEAPGQNEDEQGEPFVGQAGKLLDNMLGALNLARGRNVFIANVLKCRPPENRDPAPDEVAQCEPYLRQQIALLRPKVIVVLGRFAAQSLLRTTTPIGKLRGTVHEYEGIPVVVTYHPAYLLRTLSDKARAWEDLCLAREVHDRAGAQA